LSQKKAITTVVSILLIISASQLCTYEIIFALHLIHTIFQIFKPWIVVVQNEGTQILAGLFG
jgi:GTP1/Obg family GTP-binding protein